MFDQNKYNDAIAAFKQDFLKRQWPDENYKWVAIQWFQDHWDIEADDFAAMLKASLEKTKNLLLSKNNYPRGMIEELAGAAPEDVRGMFAALFDESTDLWTRIDAFKKQASVLKDKYRPDAGQHFQTENAITTYLWLRYPDKYYIYKYGEITVANETLNGSYVFKQGAYEANIRNFMAFCDELCQQVQKDEELIALFQSQLTPSHYPDPQMRTMAMTLEFYISRYFSEAADDQWNDWGPTNYSPMLTVEDWVKLLNDKEIFNLTALTIVKRFKDYGGAATCKQLAARYGKTISYYNMSSQQLARRIVEKTGCPVMTEKNGSTSWWPILYLGKNPSNKEEGLFVWKLRDELSAALDQVDLSDIPLYATPAKDIEETDRHTPRYWLYAPGPRAEMWEQFYQKGIVAIGWGDIGDLTTFASKEEMKQKMKETYGPDVSYTMKAHATWQFVRDMKPGDIVFAKKGLYSIVGRGVVTSDYYYDESMPEDYKNVRKINWTDKGEWPHPGQASQKTLTEITDDTEYLAKLNALFETEGTNGSKEQDKGNSPYSADDFLKDVYTDESTYSRLRTVLLRKKNIILQGAPGVGKTFAARRLAWSVMGEKDDSRIGFVQFHQNYSYEDFVMGYRPEGDSFTLRKGIFYRFCEKARSQPDKPYFFIIDEINRGNLSKIFGELLMLIELDYRNTNATLACSGESFSVPDNVHIIGMMNTADRSLAMIDYALRRRFSFFDMEPAFDSKGFRDYQASLENETFDELIGCVRDLNRQIADDKALGKGFCIGHSYFCLKPGEQCTREWMEDVVDYDILPMLREYWFDDPQSLKQWEDRLHGVFR